MDQLLSSLVRALGCVALLMLIGLLLVD